MFLSCKKKNCYKVFRNSPRWLQLIYSSNLIATRCETGSSRCSCVFFGKGLIRSSVLQARAPSSWRKNMQLKKIGRERLELFFVQEDTGRDNGINIHLTTLLREKSHGWMSETRVNKLRSSCEIASASVYISRKSTNVCQRVCNVSRSSSRTS